MDPVHKRRLVGMVQRYVVNPPARMLIRAGLAPPSQGLIETTGRKSGRPRQTPVGVAREGQQVWVVAEQGRHAQYVRNIEADPRVRVRIGRRWWAGSAHLMPDDDPRARLQAMFTKGIARQNARTVRRVGTELMTIRIDLDDER